MTIKNPKGLLFALLILATLLPIKSNNECRGQSTIFNTYPKYEVRAAWLTTIGGLDWPHGYAQSPASIEKQKKELSKILDNLKAANMNTVLLQTRIRGTVIYPSALEPWDGCCSGVPGKSPGYDPLEFAVEECHKRGMEIHAWVVTIPIGKWNGLGCRTLRNKYPRLVVKNGDEGYIDPASPMAATYIADICEEITDKYDVDGIHLDYIRYPETWKINIPKDLARANITAIVRQVSAKVKGRKPWVKMSCSPIGKYDDLRRYSSRGWNAYNKGCQEAQEWLRLGLMDQLYPMMYFRDNQFYPFAMDWKENGYGKTIVPGLGIYFLDGANGWSREEIERQLWVARANGMGHAFFRTDYLNKDTKGIYSFTKETFNLHPALTPPISWKSSIAPAPPTKIRQKVNGGHKTIYWNEPTVSTDGGVTYNVYASKTYPVDIDDARNIVAVRLRDIHLTLRDDDKLFYAVTAMDRYGNESYAAQQSEPAYNVRTNGNNFIPNDGKKMTLPEKDGFDAEYILIKDLIGSIVTTRPYRNGSADIKAVKEGLYVVYSLNGKGITHRLGFLRIYR